MADTRLMTIERHILEMQREFPQASGQFTRMLQDMAMAGKLIARETTRAGIADILGEADTENVHGETQKRLDLIADKIIYDMNNFTERVCAMASEEHEELLNIPAEYGTGDYVLLYDPLDGSSNIDVNAGIGTIFSIHRKFTHGENGTLEDVLQQGKRLVAAGYIVYGTSTMMIYTTGRGVHGFTLDPSIGEFILTHPNITFPDPPLYYSINHGNERHWSEGTKRYVAWLRGLEGDNPSPLSMRYNGALVTDFHRSLLKGGVYVYPPSEDFIAGKIRLMYEAQCLAFIAQQAGGYASDGIGNILDIVPHALHQRTPLFIGNTEIVKKAEAMFAEYDTQWLDQYRAYRATTPDFD